MLIRQYYYRNVFSRWVDLAYDILPLMNYKTTQTNGEKKKPIKIYTEDLLYELFFIADSVQEQLIIKLTKKMVVTYAVGDLTLMDS